MGSIHRRLTKKGRWLWQLNNYRNSATHRELLHFGHVAKIEIPVKKELFDKMKRGNIKIVPILEGQESTLPPDVKKVGISLDNIKTYLFKDPEDPSQGNADIEVIPYCEESLQRMKDFLEEKYCRLGI